MRDCCLCGVSVGEMVVPTALKKKITELRMNSMNDKTLTCTVLAVQQDGGIINTCLFVISTTALTVILHVICLDYRESYNVSGW